MRAVVWERPGEFRVGEVADPVPGPRELVVEVMACGICGTDLHIADGEFPPSPYPLIAGHEFAGVVVAAGPDVAGEWSEGDRVAVDPSLFCGYCAPCRAGRGNLCANWGAIGDTVDGAFAEYVAVPSANAYSIPESLGFEAAALIEPLSCAVHGIQRLGAVMGEDVLIVGAGTMGLLLGQLIRRGGARSLTFVDRKPARLDTALLLGATEVASDVSDLGGRRFAVAIDASGAPAAIESAFASLARGGRLLVFGVTREDSSVEFSPFRIYNDELTILGSMAVLNSFGAAAQLMADNEIETTPLLGEPHPLGQFAEALAQVRSGEGIKVQIAPGREGSRRRG
jgi:2-desacetyl-2-hydroxyethyl bacteriochlorophyllide A dehydrogenase